MSDGSRLYAEHLAVVLGRIETALERAGRDHLVIASGVLKYRFLDDRPYPFTPNPHFLHLLPMAAHPDCWIIVTPGRKPRLLYCQPADYWHLPPAAPTGFWPEHFDIEVIREPGAAEALLPPAGRSAILGEADAALGSHVPDNPQAVLDYLHYHRAFKTDWELACMREASLHAVRGHLAAADSFRAGASELAIHRAFLEASGQTALDVPYDSIVGLNEHAAVLHYQHQDAQPPAEHRSFLIDAGATSNGYASDITRTWSNGDAQFEALIQAMDTLQLALVDQCRPGRDYRQIQIDTHLRIAGVLQELGIVRMDPQAQLETGISSAFFPHGVGHLIGLQVHDVAGFAASDAGGTIDRPDGHPFLRLTRPMEPGMVVTIEPGLYFIDMLLEPLRHGPYRGAIDWDQVAHLARFGGVRIEDDVVCTEGAPENLTRDAFAQIAP